MRRSSYNGHLLMKFSMQKYLFVSPKFFVKPKIVTKFTFLEKWVQNVKFVVGSPKRHIIGRYVAF